MQSVDNLTQLKEAVRSLPHVLARGAGTKTALSTEANLSVAGLTGVMEYDPSEYTFTAKAGTPLAEIQSMLAEHRQFLPFDPPLVAAGATLGGTVAAGLSGAGRLRFGGIRDFLLGVRMVTGDGRIVFGGGKVVKNAAGFDIPKLMVGSLGQLGILAELTFKVFPRPEAYVTLEIETGSFEETLAIHRTLLLSQTDLSCLDVCPPTTLFVRIGGIRDALPRRIDRLREITGRDFQVLAGEQDQCVWNEAAEFAWMPPEHQLVKIPVTPGQLAVVEQGLSRANTAVARRYSVGGNIAWIAWPSSLPRTPLDELCATIDQPALTIIGPSTTPLLQRSTPNAFQQRLTSVFDPEAKFARR